ncbi:MAG: hypothetical protein AB1847_19165 [bacterium]
MHDESASFADFYDNYNNSFHNIYNGLPSIYNELSSMYGWFNGPQYGGLFDTCSSSRLWGIGVGSAYSGANTSFGNPYSNYNGWLYNAQYNGNRLYSYYNPGVPLQGNSSEESETNTCECLSCHNPHATPPAPRYDIQGTPKDTQLVGKVSIDIEGILSTDVDFSQKITVPAHRPDLFARGHFSVFDLLVYLDMNSDKFSMSYHFDPNMDTYLIDSINGSGNWFYRMNYDIAGSSEPNYKEQNHRMDYCLVKDKMFIQVRQYSEEELHMRHIIWKTEVSRRKANGGKVIIPDVVIWPKNEAPLRFRNILVTSHDLRKDVFAKGVLTAADIILSLADQEEFSCSATWYGYVGSSEVKGYYFERFNEWEASGMCGFAYTFGERIFEQSCWPPSQCNPPIPSLHITADIRLIQNPEYIQFRWLESGPCE